MKIDPNTTLKRFRNHYRLVVMNEDTFEEVVKFKLTRSSVYITLCMVFVIMIGLTVGLFVFTPLKYYLPGAGYANAREVKELRQLKMRTDSMEKALQQQSRYFTDIQNVLKGNTSATLDTTLLTVPKLENIEE